jgi:hypothetical protein
LEVTSIGRVSELGEGLNMRYAHVALLAGVVVAFVGAGTASAAPMATAFVTNSNDAGAGSFRAAVAAANANPSVDRIVFRPGLAPVALASPVVFTGAQSLDVVGSGGTLDGSGLAASDDAFAVTGGGNLSVSLLTIRNAPQEGLAYVVPASATGTRRVVLVAVAIRGNDGHGVHVDDQSNNSPASLDVRVVGSLFDGNGFGALDRDGLRVDEGGIGTLSFVVGLTRAEGSGGDGIELDERGPGDAVFNVSGTLIARNGSFHERFPPPPGVEVDLDDGMDVDESDDGGVNGKVVASSASDNFEEGWDFNENHAGDFRVDMTLVDASRNREEGVDFEEDDDVAGGGDLITTLIGVKADGNAAGDAGLKVRERGDGNVVADVRNAQANGNGAGGISIREDAVGGLTGTVDRSSTIGNGTIGIDFDENAAGDLSGTVRASTSTGNTDVGIRADQQAPGVGTLAVIATTALPNGGGAFGGNVTPTVTP